MPARAMPSAILAALAPDSAAPITVDGAPPTATGPVPPRVPPAAAVAMPRLSVPVTPQAAVRPSSLGVLATTPGERAERGSKLHYPAMDSRLLTPQPPAPVERSKLPWVLAAVALAVVGYVLLNPPGASRKPQPAVVSKPAIEAVAASSTGSIPTPTTLPEQPLPASATAPRVPETVSLPGGDLQLLDATADAAARSPRTVRISAFRMGKAEITVAEFRDFVQRTGYDNPRWQNYPCESAGGRLPDWQDPGYAQRDESPVVCVSWADANAYAQWLSRETGLAWRLPTEAEWEYAARAGSRSRFWWGNDFNDGMATCQSCPPKVPTQPAAAYAFPANPFGLHEVLGNVREWTCSAAAPYSSAAAVQCGMPTEQSRVAVRGGSWQQGIEALATDHREAYEPYRRNVWTGFRIAQELGTTAAR